jgi:hypothetical protein
MGSKRRFHELGYCPLRHQWPSSVQPDEHEPADDHQRGDNAYRTQRLFQEDNFERRPEQNASFAQGGNDRDRRDPMIARTLSKTVVFRRPFLLKGVDRMLPAGDYRVVTDEELIDGLSFPAYRRVATMIFVPAQSHRGSSIEMVTIDPQDLQAALDRDAAAP